MPELPEVETIKNDLAELIVGKAIKAVEVHAKKTVRGSAAVFVRFLIGKRFSRLDRRGKLLIFSLFGQDEYLLIHLKMTGQLIYRKGRKTVAGGHGLSMVIGDLPNKYSHVIFTFSDGSRLFFNDMRRFGYMKIADAGELASVRQEYGPEPLDKDFNLGYLAKIFHKRQAPVKGLLMNQKLLAGIGNIYADEILFAAGVRPDRKAGTLKTAEIEKIFKAVGPILRRAIKYRGTTFNDYVDGNGHRGKFMKFLKVYQREGKKCPRCGQGVIAVMKTAGRGTRYCPVCQK